jgi:hypothetical protein
MSVFSQFFLAFMSGNFSQFAFSSAGHLNSPLGWNITAYAVRLKPLNKLCRKWEKRSSAGVLFVFEIRPLYHNRGEKSPY